MLRYLFTFFLFCSSISLAFADDSLPMNKPKLSKQVLGRWTIDLGKMIAENPRQARSKNFQEKLSKMFCHFSETQLTIFERKEMVFEYVILNETTDVLELELRYQNQSEVIKVTIEDDILIIKVNRKKLYFINE